MNNYELVKKEYIKLKKEELEYLNNLSIISNNKILSEYEKIEIYRNLREFEIKIVDISKKLKEELVKVKHLTKDDLDEIIIEFDVDKDFLSLVNFYSKQSKEYVLNCLGVDMKESKFLLTIEKLIRDTRGYYSEIDQELIQNNQQLLEKPIYVFEGFYDASEDCYGPAFGYPVGYISAIYEELFSKYHNNSEKYIKKEKMQEFEKDKIIIDEGKYVYFNEVKSIFKEELLNTENKSIEECIVKTRYRVKKLNYERSPEYKEKVLLNRINELYKKVKGEYIKEELLYSDDFINILKETYKLPNNKIINKENVIYKDKKDSVLIIAITQDKEYIINIKDKNKISIEFPCGYIKKDEDIIGATKRVLKEQNGYITDNLFIIEEANSDNTHLYIVVANSCIKDEKENNSRLNSYGLFKENELDYLINNNMINDPINKLAYYSLLNNTEDGCLIYDDKKIYKHLKKKDKSL